MVTRSIIKPSSPKGFIFDPSLVLYLPLYQLDGNAFSSKDRYGHVAAVTGALWTPQGRTFDGVANIISCGTSAALGFERTDPFSLEAWIKTTSAGVDVQLIGKCMSTTPWRGYNIAVSSTANWVMFQLINSWILADYGIRVYVVFNYRDGNWHHIVGTYDGSSLASGAKIYIDGIRPGETVHYDGLTTTIQTTVPFTIGDRDGGGAAFPGTIGEVRVYNRSLSALEALRNYNANKWRYK